MSKVLVQPTKEQLNLIENAIRERQNIAITGLQGTGKSVLYAAILKTIGEMDCGYELQALDEVATMADIEVITNKTTIGKPVLFTYHSSKHLTEAFPDFKGLHIKMNSDHSKTFEITEIS